MRMISLNLDLLLYISQGLKLDNSINQNEFQNVDFLEIPYYKIYNCFKLDKLLH